MARDGGEIVGTLTLSLFPALTGVRARIEDVVGDVSARGKAVAATLTQRALDLARKAGARTVDLTSRPDREAANRLYERLGLRARGSRVYRFPMEQGAAAALPRHGD
ncbi:GNAT family N-acetyltransferase [Streptomyces sp. NPDC002206]